MIHVACVGVITDVQDLIRNTNTGSSSACSTNSTHKISFSFFFSFFISSSLDKSSLWEDPQHSSTLFCRHHQNKVAQMWACTGKQEGTQLWNLLHSSRMKQAVLHCESHATLGLWEKASQQSSISHQCPEWSQCSVKGVNVLICCHTLIDLFRAVVKLLHFQPYSDWLLVCSHIQIS